MTQDAVLIPDRPLQALRDADALPAMPKDWWPEEVHVSRDRIDARHRHPGGKKWIKLGFVRQEEHLDARLLGALRESVWHCQRMPVDDPSIAEALGDTP